MAVSRAEKLRQLRRSSQPQAVAATAKVGNAASTKAALQAQIAALQADVVSTWWTKAFDKAGVGESYRDFVRSNAGNVDPSTAAGRRVLDKYLAAHPAFIEKPAAPAAPAAPAPFEFAKDSLGAALGLRPDGDIIKGLRDGS